MLCNLCTIDTQYHPKNFMIEGTSVILQIVGKVSPWIRPDSQNQCLRRDSEAALRQELEWAAHLNLQACILPIPPSLNISNYARILNQVGFLIDPSPLRGWQGDNGGGGG